MCYRIPCNTVDRYHQFVKFHKMFNTRVNPNVNYGLLLIIMYQYWLLNFNKCTTLKQDVKYRRNWSVRDCRGTWEPSMLYVQFLCKAITTQKNNKVYFLKMHQAVKLMVVILSENNILRPQIMQDFK